MAQKKTYVYRVMIGHKDKIYEDIFIYARNANIAISYCKEKYKQFKYDYYKAVKVGLSHYLRDTEIIEGYSADKLRNSIASKEEKFSEREIEIPTFKLADDAEVENL